MFVFTCVIETADSLTFGDGAIRVALTRVVSILFFY